MKKILLVFLVLIIVNITKAQKVSVWTEDMRSRVTIAKDKSASRLSFPKEYRIFILDIEPLREELFLLADRNSGRTSVRISLPNATGQIEEFEVFEASNFEPALQDRFPEVRAYSGRGISDRYATLKLSISPAGIQTMVFRTDKENEFTEPYSADHRTYAVFRSQRTPGQLPWTCSTVDRRMVNGLNTQVLSNTAARSGGNVKTLRLAQSVTAEYSNYFGASSASQVSLVLAAVNATLTRCNGVYEKDLALHLNLIANTTSVFYYSASTDPYSDAAAGADGAWNDELQNTLTSVIGEANYDIGHLFGASGGGGNAGCIGCVCTNGSKGSGFTSPNDGIPMGDNFDIDYVVHEIGHQLGANHTFSHTNEGTGTNKEVGSGITIMGYAGITSQDVAPHSIDIYHEASIAQIQSVLNSAGCAVTTTITANNATPVVSAVSNYTIPISTPFALTGSATDANGDPLTYCWEQNDNASASQTGNSSRASATKASGPNWLSFSPTSSPTRYFPKLATILAGGLTTGPLSGGDANVTIEALSSVSRTLNFRLTVRDNCPYSSTAPIKVGQSQFTDMVVTVTNTSGPFSVTQPNTNVSWAASSSQTITWNVASTTISPVSCANVKITMSTDGGQTFPYTLIASTPNDGSEIVTLPAVSATTNARVKVEAVGNIFFDISNTNFTVTAGGTPDFSFTTPSSLNVTCASGSTATISLSTTSQNSYSTPINLSASGNPAGTTVSFSVNPVTPGNSVNVILNNANSLAYGTYTITVTGISGNITKNVSLTFIVLQGTSPSVITSPASVTVCAGSNAVFTVSTSGTVTTYQWQLSTDGGTNYSNITGANSSSYTVNSSQISQSGNKYRVLISGQCNAATSAAATLIVNSIPVIPSVTPASTTLCNGDIQMLSITQSAKLYQFGSQTNTNTTSSTSTDYPAPYSAWYGGQRMQMLVKATELQSAGFTPGSTITSIQFPVVLRGSAWGSTITSLQSFKVSIGNTTLNALTNTFQSGLTEVVPASSFTPVVGYTNTHTFSTPFTWNGSNIIIETTFSNNITGTASTTVTQYNSALSYNGTAVYRNDGVSAATAATATTANYILAFRPDCKLNGLSISGFTWSPLSGLYTDAAANNSYTGDITSTVYAKPSTNGTFTYTAQVTSGSCTAQSNSVLTVNTCQLTLNLKLFLQGYYASAGAMRATLYDLGISANPLACDSIYIDLWLPSHLMNVNPDQTHKVLLQKNGSATASISNIVAGTAYYIAVRHRNCIETWSAAPVVLNAVTSYDFTDLVNKAYSDNVNPPLKNMGNNVFAMYSGDVNTDGTVDITDMSSVEIDAAVFAFGYNQSDVTGDGGTDISDMQIIENNANLFLFYARPYQQRTIIRRMFSKMRKR